MANYQLLKADIDKKVYQNGHQEITGANLNAVLNAMVTTLGAEYQFAGVATKDTNPETTDAKVFYIANGKGTYTNFGGIEVTEDEVVVLYWDSSWHKVATGIASNEKLTELDQKFRGFYTANSAFDKGILAIYYDIPATASGHDLAISYLGVDPSNNKFYFGAYDLTENKAVGYNLTDETYNPKPTSSIQVFEFPTLLGNQASYQITNVQVIVNWKYFSAAPFINSDTTLIKLSSISPVLLDYLGGDSNKGKFIGNVNDIYEIIPENGEGVGYWGSDLSINGGTSYYRAYHFSVQKWAGKRIRLRAGDARGGNIFTNACYVKLADDSVVALYGSEYIVETNSDYALVELPSNASELFISWAKTGDEKVIPMVACEPLDTKIKIIPNIEAAISESSQKIGNVNDIYFSVPKDGEGVGFYYDDLTIGTNSDYRRYHFDISSLSGHKIRLRAGETLANNFDYFCHIKLQDDTVINLHNNTDYVIAKYENYFLVEIPIGASELYLSWDATSPYSLLPMVAHEPNDDILSSLDTAKGYDLVANGYPVIPPQLFLLSSRSMPVYKGSILPNPDTASEITINIKDAGSRKIVELTEPLNIANGDFGVQARVFLQRTRDKQNLYYKDVSVFHKDTSLLSGKTVKVMSLGDSLTEGQNWDDTPVTMLAEGLGAFGVSVEYIGTLQRTYTNNGQPVIIRYEGRGGWRYRTLVGMESKFAGINVQIPNETKSVWVEGVDGTMDEIKSYNPFLYPATAQDLVDYPDFCFHFVVGSTVENKSYSEDPTLGDYLIFDPARYFTLRNITIPDVLTIAFGVNEWYIPAYGGFNLDKAASCAEFIIRRFRQVSATMKIVVIPANNFPITLQDIWEQSFLPLCSKVIKICDTKIAAGDSNLFVCPIYAQGSRWLAFDGTIGTATDVSTNNDLKKVQMSNNVHMLYTKDESNLDYRDSLVACVANIID